MICAHRVVVRSAEHLAENFGQRHYGITQVLDDVEPPVLARRVNLSAAD